MRPPRLRTPAALLVVALLACATIVGALASAQHGRTTAVQQQRGVSNRVTAVLGAFALENSQRLADVATLMSVSRQPQTQFHLLADRLIAENNIREVWYVTRTAAQGPRGQERFWLRDAAGAGLGAAGGQVAAGAIDLGGDPQQAAMLRAAMESGSPQSTGVVRPVGRDYPAVLIAAPVYRGGTPPATVAARRAAAVGFSIGIYPVAMVRFAIGALVPAGTPFAIKSPGGVVIAGRPLAASSVRTTAVPIAGQRWVVAVGRPDPGSWLTWTIFICGTILTVAVGLLIWGAARRERYALELVDERMAERDLAEAQRHAAERRHRLLADNATDVILVFDPDGTITYISPATRELIGYEPEEVAGRMPREFTHPDDREELIAAREQISADGGTITMTCRLRHRDGRWVWVEARMRRIDDPETGAMVEGQAIVRDVSDRVASDAALREGVERIAAAEQRFRTAFEAAPIGMALSDLEGRFIQVNDALCALTGYTREELEELSFTDLSHPSDVARDEEMMQGLLSGEQHTYWMEKRYIDVVGQVVWVAVHATLVRAPDGSPQHFLGQIQDVSERVRYEAQLQHMADHDPLTGLLNRRSFERELNQHIHRIQRYGAEGAALVLDIDRFKHINDTLGHNVGDELIVKVAQTLRTRLRDSDVLARLGGDEFAVLMPRGGTAEAEAVAQSILGAVRAQSVLTAAGRRRPITTSIGIALFGESEKASAEDVLVNADLAMYDAKEAGRDRAATYSSHERGASRMKARITWAERIREALAEDRFTLYAQPIVELSSGAVRQHELLLRMIDDGGEVIPPAAFIGIAERFDLMQEIDRWVVARAIRHMGEQRRGGRELTFEVNISGSSTGDPDLLTIIERELRSNDVDPAKLVLEVTETTAVANIPRAQDFAQRLAELGCRFALDDFGAGFGSFYYLKHLPFDILKIDGEFVRSCTTNQTDQLLIRAAVDIARGMGKETIAEYVGDDQTLALLRSLGVDYAQGFHIGRPAPLREALDRDCVGG